MWFNIWGFLIAAIVFGTMLTMFVVFLEYRKTVKKLDVEALKYQRDNLHVELEASASRKLASQNAMFESIIHEDERASSGQANRY